MFNMKEFEFDSTEIRNMGMDDGGALILYYTLSVY